MPAIDIQVMAGVFSTDEKARIITAVTEGFGSIAGDTLQANTSVRIHEIQSGAWGYGGAVLTTEDARRKRLIGLRRTGDRRPARGCLPLALPESI